MAVPKRRTSKARRDKRRANQHLTPAMPIRCSRCNTPIERHTICAECGYYRGKPVISVEEAI